MAKTDGAGPIIRFGTFEADVRSGELRKRGVKIKVGDQPFSILAILLAAPGQVITRDEIQKRLWPADTFVDFERGLNKAVNRLRDALGDVDRPAGPHRRSDEVGSSHSRRTSRRKPQAP
jgi:DNA-binding winged helix-turn-helix (wHTH) protein